MAQKALERTHKLSRGNSLLRDKILGNSGTLLGQDEYFRVSGHRIDDRMRRRHRFPRRVGRGKRYGYPEYFCGNARYACCEQFGD